MNKAANTDSDGEAGVRQNLVDAECPEEAIECFIALRSKGNVPEQLAFLAMHRKTLLNRMRQTQHALDCLDFLIFTIKKQTPIEAAKHRIKE
jgi:hypothetical protein